MNMWPFPTVIHDPKIHIEYSTSRAPSKGSMKDRAYEALKRNGPMTGAEMSQALRVTRIQGINALSKLKDCGQARIIRERRGNGEPATYEAI